LVKEPRFVAARSGAGQVARESEFEVNLVRVNLVSEGLSAAGVKARRALGVIEAAEQAGQLRPGQTVIEATSGNSGIGHGVHFWKAKLGP
jgi:cysteine synthase